MKKATYISGITGLLVFALALSAQTSHADKNVNKNGSAPIALRKLVKRTIDMHSAGNKNTNTQNNSMPSLSVLLENAVKTGKISAFPADDIDLTTKLSDKDMNTLIASLTDTTIIVDPVTGAQKITASNFDFNGVHIFKILENWAYYPNTGKTEIQIAGIALLMDVFNTSGELVGARTLFWVRYNDAKNIIAQFDQHHPANTLSSYIWDDYFNNTAKPKPAK